MSGSGGKLLRRSPIGHIDDPNPDSYGKGKTPLIRFSANLTEAKPSLTELHRVRRALWRLALYLEAYFEPYIPLAIHARNELRSQCRAILGHGVNAKPLRLCGCYERENYNAKGSQRAFFQQLTVWELEELECVRYHLSHQTQAFWRRPCPFCYQQAYLPDELFAHIGECKGPQTGPTATKPRAFRSLKGSDFQEACCWFRPDLGKTKRYSQMVLRGRRVWVLGNCGSIMWRSGLIIRQRPLGATLGICLLIIGMRGGTKRGWKSVDWLILVMERRWRG